MDLNYAIVGDNIYKKYKGFTLEYSTVNDSAGICNGIDWREWCWQDNFDEHSCGHPIGL